jgi:hypothetical protein
LPRRPSARKPTPPWCAGAWAGEAAPLPSERIFPPVIRQLVCGDSCMSSGRMPM